MNDFSQLASLCLGKHIYIQTHNFPDPDAIASVFGLQRLLSLYDIPSTLCYDGRIDKLSASKMLEAFQIEMCPYEQLRPNMTEEDYIICVDAQKHSGNITDFVGNEMACIDHHPTFCTDGIPLSGYPSHRGLRYPDRAVLPAAFLQAGQRNCNRSAVWFENGYPAIHPWGNGAGY